MKTRLSERDYGLTDELIKRFNNYLYGDWQTEDNKQSNIIHLKQSIFMENQNEKQVKIFEVEKNGSTYFEVRLEDDLHEVVFFGENRMITSRQEALERAVEIAKACTRPEVRKEVFFEL